MQSPNLDPTADDDSRSAARRIERLSLHLTPTAISPHDDGQIERRECAAAKLHVDRKSLTSYMRGKHREIQDKVMDYFNQRPDLQTPVEILKDDHRELCMRQLTGLVREAGIRPLWYVVEDPAKYFAIIEAVGSVDMSLGIKMGVQYR